MKLVPLGPDAKLAKLAAGISTAAVLVLTAALVPLVQFQLGDKGWRLLQDTAGAAFWPLAAAAALGASLLLAYALGLHRHPRLGLTLLLVPVGLALTAAALGIYATQTAHMAPARGGDVVLARLAASLAAPVWALFLASGLAAAGGVVLGARVLARARSLGLPWMPLLAALATVTAVNTWSSYAKLPPRPLMSLVVAASVLGPLLAAAAWSEPAPPEAESDGGASLILCLLLSVGAVLAAVGAEALLFRAAALYAQGPGAEAHDHAMALGGARGTTIRMATGAIALLGTGLTIAVAFWRNRHELRPPSRRATPLVVAALILISLAVLGAAAHRHFLRQAISRANQLPVATDQRPPPHRAPPKPPKKGDSARPVTKP